MRTEAHRLRQQAIDWVRAAAVLNPGVKFIALLPAHDRTHAKLYSHEVPPEMYAVWVYNVELGMKDGADGRWVWDEDLDRFTRVEAGTFADKVMTMLESSAVVAGVPLEKGEI